MKTTFYAHEISSQELVDFVRKRTYRNPAYARHADFLERAAADAMRNNLRCILAHWLIRDDRGVLACPRNVDDWPMCTIDDARDMLMLQIWSDAVRLHNLKGANFPAGAK